MWCCPGGARRLGGSACTTLAQIAGARVQHAVTPMIGPRCGVHRRLIGSAPPRAGLQLLDHYHLTGDGPGGIVAYEDAEKAQEEHRASILAYKSLSDDDRAGVALPRPRLFSFESTPTFTLGRRQEDPSPDQAARLESDLTVNLTQRRTPLEATLRPQVKKTSRGGLTTYHGPGQLVLWPVLDMHSPLHERFGVASYACLLEKTTQRLLAEHFSVETYTTPDEPGVWVRPTTTRHQERKIAAMGVHHRRYVSALGIALNIDIPVVGGEDVNPWARFVPCGLEGKLVTSVAAEAGPDKVEGWDIASLAARWAEMFEEGLLKGVKSCPV